MPIALKLKESGSLFDKYKSVLVVPCGVCPKMCLSAQKNQPLIDPFGRRIKDCFEDYLGRIRESLKSKGIRTGVFRSPSRTPMMCLWPESVRNRFSRESRQYESVAVIGCESAVATVSGAVDLPADTIVQMTVNEGIANFMMETRFPFRIELVAPKERGPVPELRETPRALSIMAEAPGLTAKNF